MLKILISFVTKSSVLLFFLPAQIATAIEGNEKEEESTLAMLTVTRQKISQAALIANAEDGTGS
ncbi:MAG: hypothetical protein ABIV39_05670, partial [Verrucomicrobiota bacterium]